MSGSDTGLASSITPEAEELRRKESDLARLQSELAERELELATSMGELADIERLYLSTVGILYAELDDLELRIAEALAGGKSASPEAQQSLNQARQRAQDSARAARDAEVGGQRKRFSPSEDLKSLYRQVAKKIHPDLAATDEERRRRTEMMAAANDAYAKGDIDALKRLLAEWEGSPEAVQGEDIASRLVRAIRSIDRVRRRLVEIDERLKALRASELHELKVRYDKASADGKDLFEDMASLLRTRIADARRRLDSF